MTNTALKPVPINKHLLAIIPMISMEARPEATKRPHQVTIHTIKMVQKQAHINKPQADTHLTINTEAKQGAIKQVQTEEQQAMINMEIKQVLSKRILQVEQLNMINTGIRSKVTNRLLL